MTQFAQPSTVSREPRSRARARTARPMAAGHRIVTTSCCHRRPCGQPTGPGNPTRGTDPGRRPFGDDAPGPFPVRRPHSTHRCHERPRDIDEALHYPCTNRHRAMNRSEPEERVGSSWKRSSSGSDAPDVGCTCPWSHGRAPGIDRPTASRRIRSWSWIHITVRPAARRVMCWSPRRSGRPRR